MPDELFLSEDCLFSLRLTISADVNGAPLSPTLPVGSGHVCWSIEALGEGGVPLIDTRDRFRITARLLVLDVVWKKLRIEDCRGFDDSLIQVSNFEIFSPFLVLLIIPPSRLNLELLLWPFGMSIQVDARFETSTVGINRDGRLWSLSLAAGRDDVR